MKKKLTAIACVAAMVTMAAPMNVFAAGRTIGGNNVSTGSYEGNINSDVFDIVVPTELESTSSGAFDFIIDPNTLIAKTNAARYSGKSFEPNANLFFKNAKGDNDYSHKSDTMTLENKCGASLLVTIDAELQDVGTIKLNGKDEMDSDGVSFKPTDEETSMYMILVNETETDADEKVKYITGLSKDDKSAKIEDFGVGALASGNFEIGYDSTTDKYTYEVMTLIPDGEKKKCEFHFEGGMNTNSQAKWNTVSDTVAPKLSIVWNIAENVGDVSPAIVETSPVVFTKGVEATLTADFGAGANAATGIESITYKPSGSTGTIDMLTNGHASVSGDTITITADFTNTCAASGEIIVKFNNTTPSGGTTVTINYTVS